MSTLVSDLLRNPDYGSFQHIISEAAGRESGLQQIAVMFHLTKAAVQIAGAGTARAKNIKDMALKYFEQNLASWIIQRGGWVSVQR
jgi:putative N-acetylmannosamine-6-phosphate epimerase